MMKKIPDSSYEARWRDCRRRTRRFWWVFLTYLPGVAVVGMPLGYLLSSDSAVVVVGGVWMLAGAITHVHAMMWSCPRCGEAYFWRWCGVDAFTSRCLHCKLPKWSCDPGA